MSRISDLFLFFIIGLLISGERTFAQVKTSPRKFITNGMTITRSTIFKKGTYVFDPAHRMGSRKKEEIQVILIEGNDIVVDFNDSRLESSRAGDTPNHYASRAIFIRNSKNVTIKNLKVSGYHTALEADNVDSLQIENCDFSYNRRFRRDLDRDSDDWEWKWYEMGGMHFGIAVNLEACNNASISGCKITAAQNALRMWKCNNASIINNDFSFNAGVGILMYHSSANRIMYNKLNFNLLGYFQNDLYGGRVSGGLILFDSCSSNFIYKNSATHCGYGLLFGHIDKFWQLTNQIVGSNNNIVMSNDFSYAAGSGIVSLSSNNIIAENRLFGCNTGIFGKQSYSSIFSGNKFKDNGVDIQIWNGRDNKITYNVFYESSRALEILGKKEDYINFYTKDTNNSSHNYLIAFNNFNKCDTAIKITNTDSINVFGNIYGTVQTLYKIDSTVTNLDTTVNEEMERLVSEDTAVNIPVVPVANDPFKGSGLLAGRKNLISTEWGPYNFGYPIIRNIEKADSTGLMKFELLGPKGSWSIKRAIGFSALSLKTGSFPDSLSAVQIASDQGNRLIELEFVGPSFTNQFGKLISAKKPYIFYYMADAK